MNDKAVVVSIFHKEAGSVRSLSSRLLTPEDGRRGRQVSMLAAEAVNLMDDMGRRGLCMPRFYGDLLVAGLDFALLSSGVRLCVGGAILVVSGERKRCFDDCVLVQEGSAPRCPLKNGCAFADVELSGRVSEGDRLVQL